MLLLIIIILLTFSSVTLIFISLYPIALKKTERWHQKRVENMAPRFDRIWVNLSSNKLISINIFLPMVLATSGMFVLKSLLGAVVGFFLGLFIPHVVVRIMETRRKNKFASQLVDGIMVLSSSLKAGLSLLQSLEVLVEEMPPPISQELGLVVRENKMGVVLEDSLKSLNKRMGIEELELLVNALLVARETGGDLIKVFSRLTITIRDRQKLREKIKTLTLQGRLQGILMSALPFVFVAYVTTVNRSHFDIMLQTDNGRFLLILAVVLQAIGMFLIRKFSRIKI